MRPLGRGYPRCKGLWKPEELQHQSLRFNLLFRLQRYGELVSELNRFLRFNWDIVIDLAASK